MILVRFTHWSLLLLDHVSFFESDSCYNWNRRTVVAASLALAHFSDTVLHLAVDTGNLSVLNGIAQARRAWTKSCVPVRTGRVDDEASFLASVQLFLSAHTNAAAAAAPTLSLSEKLSGPTASANDVTPPRLSLATPFSLACEHRQLEIVLAFFDHPATCPPLPVGDRFVDIGYDEEQGLVINWYPMDEPTALKSMSERYLSLLMGASAENSDVLEKLLAHPIVVAMQVAEPSTPIRHLPDSIVVFPPRAGLLMRCAAQRDNCDSLRVLLASIHTTSPTTAVDAAAASDRACPTLFEALMEAFGGCYNPQGCSTGCAEILLGSRIFQSVLEVTAVDRAEPAVPERFVGVPVVVFPPFVRDILSSAVTNNNTNLVALVLSSMRTAVATKPVANDTGESSYAPFSFVMNEAFTGAWQMKRFQCVELLSNYGDWQPPLAAEAVVKSTRLPGRPARSLSRERVVLSPLNAREILREAASKDDTTVFGQALASLHTIVAYSRNYLLPAAARHPPLLSELLEEAFAASCRFGNGACARLLVNDGWLDEEYFLPAGDWGLVDRPFSQRERRRERTREKRFRKCFGS
ncbi:hypothetical protein DFJ73DRAFT_879348 [Zopfochytrium polystomum]|nr:hypothetical protein DFJ73DRAFT_879348 [Zopfochytrium polystomum]